MIVDGFDINAPLVCEGLIGDGCGGGRIFFMQEDSLCVYDPITKDILVLLSALENIEEISKKGCIISLRSGTKEVLFDLSTIR